VDGCSFVEPQAIAKLERGGRECRGGKAYPRPFRGFGDNVEAIARLRARFIGRYTWTFQERSPSVEASNRRLSHRSGILSHIDFDATTNTAFSPDPRGSPPALPYNHAGILHRAHRMSLRHIHQMH